MKRLTAAFLVSLGLFISAPAQADREVRCPAAQDINCTAFYNGSSKVLHCRSDKLNNFVIKNQITAYNGNNVTDIHPSHVEISHNLNGTEEGSNVVCSYILHQEKVLIAISEGPVTNAQLTGSGWNKGFFGSACKDSSNCQFRM